MADPFSVIAGTAGLLDVCWRVGAYLKNNVKAAGKIVEEFEGLEKDLESLHNVSETVRNVWDSQQKARPGTDRKVAARIDELWKDVGTILHKSHTTLEKLEALVTTVIGPDGPVVTSKLDGLKKQFRKEGKDKEMQRLRLQIANYQSSLQVLLSALNLLSLHSSQDSTDEKLSHLTEHVQSLGFKLQSQIASLRSSLPAQDSISLQESINSASAAVELVSLNKHFQVPQAVSSIFTGRAAYLKKLQYAFDREASEETHMQKRFVMYGVGGSGKTQFVCKFVTENRQRFWGIFSLDASSHESIKHSFAKIAKIGGVDPNERAAINWLASLDRPWLLIFDNADDPSMPIQDYFPESEQGLILITTRNPTHKVHGTIEPRSFEFRPLDIEDANTLLLKAACISHPWGFSEQEAAEKITEELGFLPLAVVHAGMAILNGLCTLTNYLDYYKSMWRTIRDARRKRSRRKSNADDDKNLNVYSSFEICYRGLEKQAEQDITECCDALELLKLSSFLSYENVQLDQLITAATNPRKEQMQQEKELMNQTSPKFAFRQKTWMEIFKGYGLKVLERIIQDTATSILPTLLRDDIEPFNPIRLRSAMSELVKRGLVTHCTELDGYSMHPLIHKWVRQRPQMTTADQAIWCQAATTVLTQCISLSPPDSKDSAAVEKSEALRRDLFPHVAHVRRCQEEIKADLVRIQRQHWRPYWPLIQPSFGRKQALELVKFSLIYLQSGDYQKALELQTVVKDFVTSRVGLEDSRAQDATLLLAQTYMLLSRANKAAELQRQVLDACKRSLGPNHPKTLKVMDTLGSSRLFQGRMTEAIGLHEEALDGMTQIYGVDHEDTLLAMGNLGTALGRRFRFEEAITMHMKSLKGMQKLLGSQHLNTLAAKENLATTYLDAKREQCYEEAHEFMIEVHEVRSKRLGKEQPFTLLAKLNLARAKGALRSFAEAEKLIRHAIEVAERNLGANHFGTLVGQRVLGELLMGDERYVEAESILIAINERKKYRASIDTEEGEHVDRITVLYCLIECYQFQGKNEQALETCDEMEFVLERVGGQGLGKNHPIARKLSWKRQELKRGKPLEMHG